jgi:hypothetical protein
VTAWKTKTRGDRVSQTKTWECPDCEGRFTHFHIPPSAPPPDRCPLCGAWMSSETPPDEVFVPQAPLIRTGYARAVDQAYRVTEEASIQRADEARGALEDAYRAGEKESPAQEDRVIVEEFQRDQARELHSTTKITNMKDPSQMREGDIAYIPQHIPKGEPWRSSALPGAQFQGAPGGQGGWTPGSGGSPELQYAIRGLTGAHPNTAPAMAASGRMNKD